MRTLSIAAAAAALTLVTACGGGDSTEGGAAQPADQTPTETSPAPGGSDEAGGGVLLASVGEEGNPDAFVITLTDESGQEVASLPAGEYEIRVDDPSEIHNFHLAGPGGVDESTGVPEVTETTWTVTLEAGDYTYVCDPHPIMSGGFEVT